MACLIEEDTSRKIVDEGEHRRRPDPVRLRVPDQLEEHRQRVAAAGALDRLVDAAMAERDDAGPELPKLLGAIEGWLKRNKMSAQQLADNNTDPPTFLEIVLARVLTNLQRAFTILAALALVIGIAIWIYSSKPSNPATSRFEVPRSMTTRRSSRRSTMTAADRRSSWMAVLPSSSRICRFRLIRTSFWSIPRTRVAFRAMTTTCALR